MFSHSVALNISAAAANSRDRKLEIWGTREFIMQKNQILWLSAYYVCLGVLYHGFSPLSLAVCTWSSTDLRRSKLTALSITKSGF